MTQVCPISFKQVNESLTRLNAFVTVLLIIGFLLSHSIFILVFLIADFAIRGFYEGRWSLISILNRKLLNYLAIKPKLTNAGPKFFAAKIGFVVALSIFISWLAGFETLALILASILILFAALEFSFGICVACMIYPFLINRKVSTL